MKLKKILTMTELNEIDSIVKKSKTHFNDKYIRDESKMDWYAGVTGQGKDKEFELERIKDHHYDDYPNLDIDSIGYWKVSNADISVKIEKKLEKIGFYTGKHNPPKEDEDVYVYIFRKEE